MMETKSLLCQPSQVDDKYPHLHDGPIVNSELEEINGGAFVEFKGVIRPDEVKGQTVSYIDYEVYFPVAEKILAKIEAECLVEYDLKTCRITHSFGKIGVGECSLLIQVVSKHRKEAFEACAKIVDRIKDEAPVWKQEFYTDKSYNWVRCSCH